nr:MAG TPA: hypothetical protein [Caudoviricetes sp.]
MPHLKVLLIFLLKIPKAHIDTPRSTPLILRMFVERQIWHLGALLFSSKITIIK